MGTPADNKYMEFKEKVKRTVYVDNLSPKVTEVVVRTALNQFGNVTNVQFIPNYVEKKTIPRCALVEMVTAEQAKAIIGEMTEYPFMMSGMPRPVRAFSAEEAMFVDRPAKPGGKIQCEWMDPSDPNFGFANKLKNLTKKHRAEASFLLEQQLEEEENLAKQQSESLKANYKKFQMIDRVQGDGTVGRLARHFNLRMMDDQVFSLPSSRSLVESQ